MLVTNGYDILSHPTFYVNLILWACTLFFLKKKKKMISTFPLDVLFSDNQLLMLDQNEAIC